MATITEIDNASEAIGTNALADMGYQANVDTRQPESTFIEAIHIGKKLLVQVKAAVLPDTPAPLSSEEEKNIKARAMNPGREAWEAKVRLNTALRLAGEIEWHKRE